MYHPTHVMLANLLAEKRRHSGTATGWDHTQH